MNRSEEEIVLEVLTYWNGTFFSASTVERLVKQVDRKFSGEKIQSSLRKLAREGKVQVEREKQPKRGGKQKIRYGISMEGKPLRMFPTDAKQARPGVRVADRDPRHEDIIPFEPWED